MTDTELAALGDYFKSLMSDDRFNMLCDEVKKQITYIILHSLPNDTATREQHYHQIHGVQRLLDRMLHYVDQARLLREMNDPKEEVLED